MKQKYGLVDGDGKPVKGMPVNDRDGMPYTDFRQGQEHRDAWRAKRKVKLPRDLPGDAPKNIGGPKKLGSPKTKSGGFKANFGGILGAVVVPLSILKSLTGAAADAKECGTSFWDELWENEIEEPFWVIPGGINPSNPAFKDDESIFRA
jgi:hypothetical protein